MANFDNDINHLLACILFLRKYCVNKYNYVAKMISTAQTGDEAIGMVLLKRKYTEDYETKANCEPFAEIGFQRLVAKDYTNMGSVWSTTPTMMSKLTRCLFTICRRKS